MRPHIGPMKRILLIISLGLSAPAYAEDSTDGLSLMERGAQLLMEGLMQEMEPALDNLKELADEFGPALESFSTQMGPALRGLLAEVEDWSVYHPPEMLDNGDIIIRRKVPTEDEMTPEVQAEPEEQIDI
ncbi:hypothetical protein [Tateyamaria pelophila]|uniref:hypothetical protein n=1 Tax=Tateyamaria pelophila TaxID=328415 RepID=UPI001CC01718|nr:hypothetical protein [Tateyamaria pelophila]